MITVITVMKLIYRWKSIIKKNKIIIIIIIIKKETDKQARLD